MQKNSGTKTVFNTIININNVWFNNTVIVIKLCLSLCNIYFFIKNIYIWIYINTSKIHINNQNIFNCMNL